MGAGAVHEGLCLSELVHSNCRQLRYGEKQLLMQSSAENGIIINIGSIFKCDDESGSSIASNEIIAENRLSQIVRSNSLPHVRKIGKRPSRFCNDFTFHGCINWNDCHTEKIFFKFVLLVCKTFLRTHSHT